MMCGFFANMRACDIISIPPTITAADNCNIEFSHILMISNGQKKCGTQLKCYSTLWLSAAKPKPQLWQPPVRRREKNTTTVRTHENLN